MQSKGIKEFAKWLRKLKGCLTDPTPAGPASGLFCVVLEARKRGYREPRELVTDGDIWKCCSHYSPINILPSTQAAVVELSPPQTHTHTHCVHSFFYISLESSLFSHSHCCKSTHRLLC